jgi:SHS2 domain-containing protein
MAHEWIDHTAELELRLDSPSEAEVFADALRALAELLADGDAAEPAAFDVEVTAGDRATLLAAWLDELVFRAETGGLVPAAIDRLDLEPGRLRARVRAHRGDPRHIIKGVTYHRLSFEPSGDGYSATLVLDV